MSVVDVEALCVGEQAELPIMSYHMVSASAWDFHGLQNIGAWVMAMGQSVGDEIGKGWLVVAGTVCGAGIIAAVAFAMTTGNDISKLKTQQEYMSRDVQELRDGQRDIGRALGINYGNFERRQTGQ